METKQCHLKDLEQMQFVYVNQIKEITDKLYQAEGCIKEFEDLHPEDDSKVIDTLC